MAHQADVKEVTISPSKAATILKRHTTVVEADPTKRNRTIKKSAVNRYASDMLAGRWQFNAETLKLAVDGRIIDGQHRLLACVAADKSFRTLLVEGVADEVFQTVDIGVVRTGGDLLHIAGRLNSVVLANALALLWRWERGESKQFVDWHASPTKPELREILDRHPDVEFFISKIGPVSGLMTKGLAAVLWYLFAKRDAILADLFFSALGSGLNMKQDDPVYALRERLIKDKAAKYPTKPEQTAELAIRAWNATRKGQRLTKLISPKANAKASRVRHAEPR